MVCGLLLSPSLPEKGALAMNFPPISFETAAVILLLLSGILFLLVGVLYCVYKFYIKFSLARLRITELQERMRNERI